MTGYQILDKSLHSTADAARKYFAGILGIAESKFLLDQPVPMTGSKYVITLQAKTREQRIVCVDVATRYTEALDGFVLACVGRSIPVELTIAIPPDTPAANHKEIVEKATANGLGVLSIASPPSPPTHVRTAIPLSVAALRRPNLKDYPKRSVAKVNHATQTFLSSDPDSAVLMLYKEIERLSRHLAEKAEKMGCWKALKSGATSPGINWDKANWQPVMEALLRHLDTQKLKCPALTPSFLGSVLGLTQPRNSRGHKPKTVAERVKIDSEARTDFEVAADTLKAFLDAVSSLKLPL